jgi:G protein-coupled receptor GPR1
MAPLSTRIAHAMYEIELEPRGLGSTNSTNTEETFTPSEENTLQALALAFSMISVSSAILAFYWFIKMRRSFRHE